MLDILHFDVTFSRKALYRNAFRLASFLSTQEKALHLEVPFCTMHQEWPTADLRADSSI